MLPIDDGLFRRLHSQANAERWHVPLAPFSAALAASAGKAFATSTPNEDEVERYLSSLHLEDLALACGCAVGDEDAWEHFVREYRPPLYRTADAMDPTGGARELVDSLYGDLFGVSDRGTDRQSLFRYFHGRSSLATWLRAVLSQRLVDRARAARHREDLPDEDSPKAIAAPDRLEDPERDRDLHLMQDALAHAVDALDTRDRLRLRCYYAQGLTLAETGRLTREHEATVSRHLARTRLAIRQDVERRLRAVGLTDAQIARCVVSATTDAGPLDVQTLLRRRPRPQGIARRSFSGGEGAMTDASRRDESTDALLRRTLGPGHDPDTTDACLDAEIAAAWLDGRLHGTALEHARTHVADCARCQALMATLVRAEGVAPTVVTPEASPRRSWWMWLAPVAAAAAILVIAIALPRKTPQVAVTPAPAQEQPKLADANKAQVEAAPTEERKAEAPRIDAKDADQAAKLDKNKRQQDAQARATAPAANDAKPANEVAATAPPPPPVQASPTPSPLRDEGRMREMVQAPPVKRDEIASPDPMIRWRLRRRTVEKSIDGGRSWTAVPTGIDAEWTAGVAPTPTTCWLVGREGHGCENHRRPRVRTHPVSRGNESVSCPGGRRANRDSFVGRRPHLQHDRRRPVLGPPPPARNPTGSVQEIAASSQARGHEAPGPAVGGAILERSRVPCPPDT